MASPAAGYIPLAEAGAEEALREVRGQRLQALVAASGQPAAATTDDVSMHSAEDGWMEVDPPQSSGAAAAAAGAAGGGVQAPAAVPASAGPGPASAQRAAAGSEAPALPAAAAAVEGDVIILPTYMAGSQLPARHMHAGAEEEGEGHLVAAAQQRSPQPHPRGRLPRRLAPGGGLQLQLQ